MQSESGLYDATFYDRQADGSTSSAAAVIPTLIDMFTPVSVLDVGCGVGTWVAEWIRRGVGAYGVDGAYAQPILRIPSEIFTDHDLTQPLDLQQRYSLVTCMEVAEHVPHDAAPVLVESLCRHADVILFSAAVPDQGGTGHINERWPSYWAPLFAAHGYRPYDVVRKQFWWDQRVEWWYRQNMIVFATDDAAREHNLGEPVDNITRLNIAHPALNDVKLRTRVHATVCIPWRPTMSRIAAFERAQQFWAQTFPSWPVVTADSQTDIFSLAQARNNAVRKADTNVVVICDADTVPLPQNVVRAVADPVGVTWPFDRYRILPPDSLDTPFEELPNVPIVNRQDGEGMVNAVGACLVTTRSEYWRLGGSPPQFCGWGWEDAAFNAVVRTLSTARRIPGHVYAFEHNTNMETYTGAIADSPGWDRDPKRNKALFSPYQSADGRPWMMREVIKPYLPQ
ncbi:methyltransferase domain-containing protein [Mycolicibacterium sphagni]|uniref:methyltransferase domain-containing protein n=1 Tax=Mycolicibacterium sphagni TaxID=1786 RepID=UPI0021F3B20F|nr:methyltransferase domain-containing protein [Mycolicibacterium sphagni]MCV7174922.1 methyltransferase domain-containing protein [Mycolicibacterium sphagni]